MKNPFKVGDKIRFIDNELNRAEIPSKWFMPNMELTVFRVLNNGCLELERQKCIEWSKLHYSRFELAEPEEGGVWKTVYDYNKQSANLAGEEK